MQHPADRDRGRVLLRHGALVFLLGLLAGFPYGSVALGPDAEAIRGWHMAHMEGVLNGLLIMALGAGLPLLNLSARQGNWLCALAGFTGYANALASWIEASFHVRGFVPGGSTANFAVFILFTLAILTGLMALALMVYGTRRDAGASSAESLKGV